jgi:hypothetical protein
MGNIYLALLHYPVYNKQREVIATCITGFDLHDIARTAATFGVKKYFVVNPLPAQREFARRIVDFWREDESQEFNWTRAEAFKLISIKENLEEVITEIKEEEGERPILVGTSAKPKGSKGFEALRVDIVNSKAPYLILLGTGWGMTEELLAKMDVILAPIKGTSEYNHLPVRSANAIILDRLIGKRAREGP